MTFEIDTQISYNVLWGDDENDIHPAEIIERRPILKYRESGKLIDECKLTPSEFEYYVHYIDCDTRDKTFDAEIVGHLVEVLRATGRQREANDLLKQARERFPKDDYLQKLNQDLSAQ